MLLLISHFPGLTEAARISGAPSVLGWVIARRPPIVSLIRLVPGPETSPAADLGLPVPSPLRSRPSSP